MTTRHNIRAFSVAEFSAVHRALREIRSRQNNEPPLSREQESDLLHQRIQEIIESSQPSTPCK
jgi:hypothetical protein